MGENVIHFHGKTFFRGLHDPDDILHLSVRQQELFVGKEAGIGLEAIVAVTGLTINEVENL